MSDDLIWYFNSDSTNGPVSIRDLDVLLRTNAINSSTLIYRDGFEQWIPFRNVPELREFLVQQEHEILAIQKVMPRKGSNDSDGEIKQIPIQIVTPPVEQEDSEPQDIEELDEEKLQLLKKKIEKKMKKAKRQKQKKKELWYQPKINTNIYVQGLPPDITFEEMKDYFSKAGLIRINPETLQPAIKIYRNEDGTWKGDGLISYKMAESVSIAKDILQGGQIKQQQYFQHIFKIRAGFHIIVEEAQFQQKGEYKARQQKQVDKMKQLQAKQKEIAQLGWDGDTKEALKIVVLKHMFEPDLTPEIMEDLKQDVLGEVEISIGKVQKIEIYPQHKDGVIKLKFLSALDAEQCIETMNGRFFDGRKIVAVYWDGKEDYKKEDLTNQDQRLDEFGKWLEENE